jgi:hypothetical protein
MNNDVRLSIIHHRPCSLRDSDQRAIRELVGTDPAVRLAGSIWMAWGDGELMGVCCVRSRQMSRALVARVSRLVTRPGLDTEQLLSWVREQTAAQSEQPLLWVHDVGPTAACMTVEAAAAAGDAVAVLAATLAQAGLDTAPISVHGAEAIRCVG